jgi:hypothetical protein
MLKGDMLFVSSSLRRGSSNTALLREAANALPSGVRLDGIAGLPPYRGVESGHGAASWKMRAAKTGGSHHRPRERHAPVHAVDLSAGRPGSHP